MNGLKAFDLLVLASLAMFPGRAVADEVAHQFNAIVAAGVIPRQRAQGMAQSLLRLHRLGHVEVAGTIFGVNAYAMTSTTSSTSYREEPAACTT
jgi:hypothetical protein